MVKKFLLVMPLLTLLFSFSSWQKQPLSGQKVFESKCAKCHGIDGTKERAGAKNLKLSKLSDAEIMLMIQEGKKVMPSFKKKLLPEEIRSVADYVKNLRR